MNTCGKNIPCHDLNYVHSSYGNQTVIGYCTNTLIKMVEQGNFCTLIVTIMQE